MLTPRKPPPGEPAAHRTAAMAPRLRVLQVEIEHLQQIANDLHDSFFFLEFAIPRMGKRADVIIVTGAGL